MFKLMKNKMFLIMSLCLVTVLSITGLNLFNKQKKVIYAEPTHISLSRGIINKTTNGSTNAEDVSGAAFTSIGEYYNNNNIIMLDSSRSEETDALEVKFELPLSADETIVGDIRETVTLNGININSGRKMEITKPDSESDEEGFTFIQYLYFSKNIETNDDNLTDSQLTLTGNALQGLYTYTFEYVTDKTTTGTIVESISFYLTFDSCYYNTTEHSTPILHNTEKIGRYAYMPTGSTEYANTTQYADEYIYTYTNKRHEANFFNFNNKTTTGYNGVNVTSETLLYPTYTYDASKFNLSYTYIENGLTYEYTTLFQIDENGNGILNLYENGILYDQKELTKTDDLYEDENNHIINHSNRYIVNLEFDQVGDYSFTLLPVVAVKTTYNSNIEYHVINETNSNTLKNLGEQEQYLGAVELSIFGYQLFHSNYDEEIDVDDIEFKNDYLSADVTHKTQANIQNNAIESVEFDGVLLNNNTAFNANFFNEEVVTNQAPVSFDKYYATMNYSGLTSQSFYLYYETNTSNPTITELSNSTMFINNGYYIAVCFYGFSDYEYFNPENGNVLHHSLEDTLAFYQVFSFRINNVEPSVLMYEMNENSSIQSEAIVNCDVLYTYQANTAFDVKSKLTLSYTTTKDGEYINAVADKDYQVLGENAKGYNEIKVLAKNGVTTWWKASLDYGPNQSTNITQYFIIDMEPITSEAFSVQLDKGTYYYENASLIANNQTIMGSTNGKFIVNFTDTKTSGATVSASYRFIELIKDNNAPTSYNDTTTNNLEYIYNGYKLDNQFVKYNYGKATASFEKGKYLLEGTNANYVLSNAGLYIFEFKDSAGNVNYKYIFLDNSNPIVLIDDGITSDYQILEDYSIYLQSVNVIHGKNKAIDVSSLINPINDDSSAYDIADIESLIITDILTNLTLAEKIQDITYQLTPVRAISETESGNAGNTYITTTGIQLKLEKSSDEETYHIVVTDKLNNSAKTKTVKLSTDNSLFTAYRYDETLTSYIVSANSALGELKTTKDENLYFSWINNEGEYAISSLTGYFYPLTYDVTSTNYPYAETYSTTTNLLANSLLGTMQNGASSINVYISSTPFTTSGMYIIERTYANNLPNGSLDMQTRRYVYFIDRNEIFDKISISGNQTFTIGSEINLTLSNIVNINNNQPYQKILDATQFILTKSGNTLFDTNKLPVTLNFVENLYKYSTNQNLTNAENNSTIFNNVHKNSYTYNGSLATNWFTAIQQVFKLTIETNGDYVKNNTNYIYTNANGYEITISDSSAGEPISHTLVFSISNTPPNGEFIQTTTNGFINLNNNPILNTTEGVKFAWQNPTNDYSAIINKDKVTVSLNGIQYKDVNITTSKLNGFDYEIDLSSLITNYDSDILVQIYLEYYGYNGNYEGYVFTEMLYFDFTAPDLNYQRLLASDNFLTADQKASFEDYNSLINFENYAFTIDENFTFQTDTNAVEGNFYTNTKVIYYRYYEKYEEIANADEYVNLQSIISSDPRYEDLNKYKNPRFSIFDGEYTQINTLTENNKTFFDLLLSKSASNIYGYYEIIEVDEAGNERIYSVYLPDTSAEMDYVEQAGFNGNKTQDNNTVIVNAESYTITDIKYLLNTVNFAHKTWFTLKISKNGAHYAEFKIAPIDIDGYITLQTAIELMNELMKDVDTVNGTNFTFSLSFNTINDISTNNYTSNLIYNYPSEKIELSFTQGTDGSKRILQVTWNNSASTYITEIKIEKAINGKYEELKQDDKSNPIKLDSPNEFGYIEAKVFIFDISAGGDFRFTLKDNFNRTYYDRETIGLEDVATIEFADNFKIIDGTYYTAGQAYAVLQSAIYKISVFAYDENGVMNTESLTAVEMTQLGMTLSYYNELAYISLFNLNKEEKGNEIQKYTIFYTDVENESQPVSSFTVEYMPLLGKIEIKDNSGNVLFNEENIGKLNVTSKSCYVYIDDSLIHSELPTSVYGVKKFQDEEIDLGKLQNGECLYEVGDYTLTIINELGTTITLSFEIRSAISKDVSVITASKKQLSPSEVKYNYASDEIDWYFTTEEYVIELSSVRYTQQTLEATADNGSTKIYKLFNNLTGNDHKEKYIAVTTVAKSSNFVKENDNYLMIDGTKIDNKAKQYKSTNSIFTLSINQNYNTYQGNLITISYSYNNSPITKLDTNNITFNQSGIYRFYFTDFAGNIQVFDNNSYFKVMLFNEMIVYVNNAQKIQDAVFNSTVVVSVQEASEYDNNNFVLSAKKDGKSIKINKVNNSYTFTEYGVYNITISGKMDDKDISTTFNFVILNENEALVAYEYIAHSNYEITKIEKDGDDVTDIIKKQISNSLFEDENTIINNITSLALSGIENGIGGNGKYTITVLARNINNNINSEFSFNVWINADNEVYILSNIEAGASSTGSVQVKVNTTQVYEKIGMCNITINDVTWIAIASDGTVTVNENSSIKLKTQSSNTLSFSTYELLSYKDYNFKIETISGNTLMSFTITKAEPLNSVAVLVIVISVIAIGAIVTVFLLLRKRMKVK